uniref:DUF7869 domain-containing protein n=1 Tax=Cacopsylla melanoneura TaxID=428564 RepID=A0A8D8ZBZ9_9HEMI
MNSCILDYIKKTSEKCTENVNIVFYSDNCCGQQKNKFTISNYLYAVNHFKNVDSIEHKFLVVGHTQNEGDNVHSVIEKQIMRKLNSGPIYCPLQYAAIIRSAKKKGNPYRVTEFCHTDFLDIKDLNSRIGNNFSRTTSGAAQI